MLRVRIPTYLPICNSNVLKIESVTQREREREREREKHEPKVGPPADFRIFFYLSKHLFAISLSVRSVVCSKGRIINPLPCKMFDDKFELVYGRWGQLCKPFLSYLMRTSAARF